MRPAIPVPSTEASPNGLAWEVTVSLRSSRLARVAGGVLECGRRRARSRVGGGRHPRIGLQPIGVFGQLHLSSAHAGVDFGFDGTRGGRPLLVQPVGLSQQLAASVDDQLVTVPEMLAGAI